MQNIFTVAKILALVLLIVVGLTVAADSRAIAANTQRRLGRHLSRPAVFRRFKTRSAARRG